MEEGEGRRTGRRTVGGGKSKIGEGGRRERGEGPVTRHGERGGRINNDHRNIR
jgi:hypothetical protein